MIECIVERSEKSYGFSNETSIGMLKSHVCHENSSRKLQQIEFKIAHE